jgi:uncharacterized protein GlcG (DUF336 family)
MSITIPSERLSGETAQALIAAAIVAAREIETPVAIAVCDATGQLQSYHRMDGAPLMSAGIAQDKAYTAAGFGRPTHEWHPAIAGDAPLLHGFVHTPRLVIFGGGYPLRANGHLLGGIGVSGGETAQDMQCAEAAMEACGLV